MLKIQFEKFEHLQRKSEELGSQPRVPKVKPSAAKVGKEDDDDGDDGDYSPTASLQRKER